jgi:hypothetical protein
MDASFAEQQTLSVVILSGKGLVRSGKPNSPAEVTLF